MGMQDVVDALLGRPGAKVQKRGSILPMVKTDEGMGLGWPEKYGVLGGLGIPAMGGIYGAGERQ